MYRIGGESVCLCSPKHILCHEYKAKNNQNKVLIVHRKSMHCFMDKQHCSKVTVTTFEHKKFFFFEQKKSLCRVQRIGTDCWKMQLSAG